MTKRAYFRAWILCGALASLLGATGTVFAQPATDPDKRATELYKKGNEFYDKSKWADAENMYKAALDLRHSFEIAGNLGDVQMIQGKAREAAENLSFAIRNFPATGKPAQREALRKRLDEATKLIGTVNVKVSVPAAEVFLDGKPIGKAPLEYEHYVDRGEHVVEAKAEGYEDGKETLTATAGSKHDINITLKEKAKPKPKTTEPPPPPPDKGIFAGKSLPILIAGAGLTVIGLGVGIGTAVAANGKASDADGLISGMPKNGCAPPIDPAMSASCSMLLDTRQSQDSLANASMAAFIVGGVAGAATVGYFFLWPKPKSTQTGWIAPMPVLTPNEGGLWLKGSF